MEADIVRSFLTGLGPDIEGARKTYREFLAEDCLWENSGFPPCEGRDAALALLDVYFQVLNFEHMEVEFRHVLADGPNVLVERREAHVAVDGSIIGGDWVNVMGSFEVRDGKITAWRDYFDPTPFVSHFTQALQG